MYSTDHACDAMHEDTCEFVNSILHLDATILPVRARSGIQYSTDHASSYLIAFSEFANRMHEHLISRSPHPPRTERSNTPWIEIFARPPLP